MKPIKAFGKIERGGFTPRNPNVYYQQIKDAGNVHDCLITIEGSNRRSVDQNSYAFAVCNQIAVAMNQEGWDVTAYEVYKRAENQHCSTFKEHPRTGKMIEFVKPLKEQDAESFWRIIETIRVSAMQNLDIHIDTPAQHYGITEEAYDLMRSGAINFLEAKRMSEKLNPEIQPVLS